MQEGPRLTRLRGPLLRGIINIALPTNPAPQIQPVETTLDPHEGLTGSILQIVLRWQFVWVLFVAVVDAPFLAANKAGAAWIALALAVFTVFIPAVFLQIGKPVAAARIFVTSAAAVLTALAFFARGVFGMAPVLQLSVAVVATVLLGRNAAFLISIACLLADLWMAVMEASGRHLLVLFPGNALSNWSGIAIAFGVSTPAMYLAVSRLRAALAQSQNQLTALRQAEEHIVYQAQLIAQSADPVIAADNDRKVTFWNVAAERVLGWTEQDAVGKNIEEVVRFAPGSIPRDRFRAELARDGRWEGELALLTAAGESRHIGLAITVLHNARGEAIGTVGAFRDITERRLAEDELKRSEERLQRVTETVPVGILMLDRSGNFVFANSSAAELVGMPTSELLHKAVSSPDWEVTDFFGNPFPLEERPFFRVMTTGKPVHDVNYAISQPSGKRRYFSVSAAPVFDPSGGVDSVVAVIEDITERRELEEQYWHAQRMESLGRLAGGVAHDFNNLLTVVNGYSQLLLQRASTESIPPDTLRDPLERILRSGRRAAELAQQLLGFSRKQVASPCALVLNDLISGSEAMLRRLLGSDVELITKLATTAGTILADSGQMQQVLLNLLVNARDAMPEGGKVFVETENLEVYPDDRERVPEIPAGAYVLLTVEDTGTGIDQETQKHIFEPFFTTKSIGYGSGLGLATVYGIVKQSNGSIRVQSQPGKGARFCLYFPRVDAAPESVDYLPELNTLGGSETVLLVDDEPDVRMFLVDCLRSYGYTVIEAGSCEEALSVSWKLPGTIDLLVTDMLMPGMSGRQLAEALEAERPGLRVLLASGYSAEQVRPAGLALDRFAFVQKPVSPLDLLSKVRRLLGTSKPTPPVISTQN